MRGHPLIVILLGMLGIASTASAEPTEIAVRVISKGGKFIGSPIGGMHIVLRDALTAVVLAEGVLRGGSGNTERIMTRARRGELSDASVATFRATLDLDEPRLIEVQAVGPFGQPQASVRVSSMQWVVPGRPVTGGDAWTLEVPGLAVDILDPPAYRRLDKESADVEVRTNVVMMCGCAIEAGGTWDAKRLQVEAILRSEGRMIGRYALSYAGIASEFKTRVPVKEPGSYELIVTAYDASNGNTGVDRTTFNAP